jgi:hypothetical protein
MDRILVELGEPPLSNLTELRRLYEARLAGMRSIIIERLRRHHYDDFRNGRDLAIYVERKTLAFLSFNAEWGLSREMLDMEIVHEHVFRLLDEALGKDVLPTLVPLNGIIDANRKSVSSLRKKRCR